jgi:uncharacterized protein YfaS (alpha-2-macroglobulin family)
VTPQRLPVQLVPFAALLVALAACGGPSSKPPPPAGHGAGSGSQVVVGARDIDQGLELRVSNGQQGAPAFDRTKLAPAKRLGDGDAEALLARTKPIAADPADPQAFALRAGSQPPPHTGQTITSSFPPPAASTLPPPAAHDTGELRVVRFMPEGKVPLAPEVSVTFSQPMVAVTSQADAAATTPVTLSPPAKGAWRWIGTRTIVFAPEVRLPQATTFKVAIPAGTKSATGGALAKAVEFSFETPPPRVVNHFPSSGSQRRDVPIFLLFDQKIDAQAVLAHVTVTAAGTPQPIQLLDASERAAAKPIAALIDAATKDGQDGRWLALRPTRMLPADAEVEVTIGAGTPSAEGANPTREPEKLSFHTYPPLQITHAQCSGYRACPPGSVFSIDFNNPLDVDKFDDAQLTITPAIPGLQIHQYGSTIMVTGNTAPHTTYEIDVDPGVTDVFGQTLGSHGKQTWPIGAAMPTFYGPDGVVVLDPSAKQPTLDFYSASYAQLKVQLYAVTPADFNAFENLLAHRWDHDHPAPVPGRKVTDRMVKVLGDKDRLVETHLDLSPALVDNHVGQVIAIVEPAPWTGERGESPPQMIAWAQATQLGIDAHADNENLIAYATDLAIGKRAAGVTITLQPAGVTATTDASGMATLALPSKEPPTASYLVARKGNDVAFIEGSWVHYARGKVLAWYVTDDRKLYKPGEEVSIKGWLRTLDQAKNGDIGGLGGSVTSVTYKVTDSTGNQIAQGAAPVSAVGGFDTRFTLPKTPNLGEAMVLFEARGSLSSSFNHQVQVEEFRRPEFEVSAQASQGPFVVGGAGDVTVSAKYFAGGPLAGADVSWRVTAEPTVFTPPNHDDYTFGAWVPWWHGPIFGGDDDVRAKPPKWWTLTGKTDAIGAHTLHLDYLSVNPPQPMSVTATAEVADVNRQAWTASSTMIVHPSSLYVGLKAKKLFVDKGTPFALDVIGVDVDGKAVPGAKIDVTAARLQWEFKKGKYQTKRVGEQTCHVVAAAAAVPCAFTTQDGGEYQIVATIIDDKARANQSKLTFWVAGGEHPPAREVERETVQIIPNQKTYAAGDTAELFVQAPFFPAEGLVSWRRSGIVKTELVTFDGPTQVIKVPIADTMVPNLTVQIDLVGAATRTDDHGAPVPALAKRPAYAVGTIDLSVPPRQRTLAVTVTPAATKLAPGEKTQLALTVTDAHGQPVANAEAAVIVVDEAILALTGATFASPIDTFYAARDAGVSDVYSRAYLRLARPDLVAPPATVGAMGGGGPPGAPPPPPPAPMALSAPMEAADAAPAPSRRMLAAEPMAKAAKLRKPELQAGYGEAAPAQTAIAIRSDFNPLAAFAPAVHTDAAGKATVELKLPDNLTRYRVVAIAVAGDQQFGKGESTLTARLPLMVRPSPPRFLNFGDTFKLPVVVQNQTDNPMTVRVAVRATNAALSEGAGRELAVPANDRVEVQFPIAAELAGTARLQVVGAAGAASDAAEVAIPVWTPATTEAFATYGVIDDGAIQQPVALPGQVVTQFGGLDVTTASTNLQSLTDAVLYLVHYPFECAEQRSSRIVAIAALKDVLAAFHAKDLPSVAAMTASVATDIERLTQMQNADGGFAFWDRGHPSEPYLSVFVASALGRARDKGFAVPAELLERAKLYLRTIETRYPSDYGPETRWAISAFALATRKQLGDLDVAKAKALFAEAGIAKLPLEASGWLLATLAQSPAAAAERKAIVQNALNKVAETAGAANFTTSYGDGAHVLLASDRRVDAVLLDALIQDQKDLDLIPKLVTGLLAHRTAGHWLNTQENSFALVALDRYFQTYEKATPDFVARVWLGDDYAGDHAFKGRTTQSADVHIAMKDVARHDKAALTIQKEGAGRLYYRIGMIYAPASLQLAPADYGFVVERRYEAVDDAKDVTRAADGVWHIKAGARVRVRLSMVNDNRRYQVALVDPLPAGLETLNPALATTGPIPTDPAQQRARGAYWWWFGPWYEHQNLRDERVEAFASLLWEGVHKYDYVARATTPGSFVVPPPRAEEMYMPETFGRGASDRVIVE